MTYILESGLAGVFVGDVDDVAAVGVGASNVPLVTLTSHLQILQLHHTILCST